MSARTETQALMYRLEQRGVSATFDDVNTLRRAQLVLHRWAELECGDGNDFASWAIERDESTSVPYLCTYPHQGKPRRERIADREKGAIRRVAEVCKRLGAHFYHQTDPRGCALYIGAERLTDQNYSRGIACVS